MRKLLISLLTLGFVLGSAFVATAEGSEESMEGPMEISFQGIYGDAVEEGNAVQRALEEKFNIKITDSNLARRPRETIDLMIGADEHPDAMYSWTNHDQWYAAGAYRPIPIDMIREHAPNLARDWDTIGPGALDDVGGPRRCDLPCAASRAAMRTRPVPARRSTSATTGWAWSAHARRWACPRTWSRAPRVLKGVLDGNPGFDPGHWFISYNTPNIVDVEAALEAIVAADPVGGGRTIGYSGWPREGRPCLLVVVRCGVPGIRRQLRIMVGSQHGRRQRDDPLRLGQREDRPEDPAALVPEGHPGQRDPRIRPRRIR